MCTCTIREPVLDLFAAGTSYICAGGRVAPKDRCLRHHGRAQLCDPAYLLPHVNTPRFNRNSHAMPPPPPPPPPPLGGGGGATELAVAEAVAALLLAIGSRSFADTTAVTGSSPAATGVYCTCAVASVFVRR